MNSLMTNCRCGAAYPSDLNRWRNVYLSCGEVWWETCPHCGAEWQLSINVERSDGLRSAEGAVA